MQVTAGRVPGGSDVPDPLAPPHVLADPHLVPGQMVVHRGDRRASDDAVVQEEPVPVAAVVIPVGDDTTRGSVDRRTAAAAEVSAVVQLQVTQATVEPEPR